MDKWHGRCLRCCVSRRISQRDIAKMLGINVSTVSRALAGGEGVSEELRLRIKEIATANNYRPNPFAMSLRYDTPKIIGIIVPDLANLQYLQVVRSIEREAKENGYLCIITSSNDNMADEQATIQRLANMHVEGIIACLSQETSNYSHLEELRRQNIPLVLFDQTSPRKDFPAVTINDAASAREATLYLIDHGARKIALLGGANHLRIVSERKHGYLEALRERGLPIVKELIKCNHLSYNSGLTDTYELLTTSSPPDAILAMDDTLTIAALQAAKSLGRRIPEDLSIIGYTSEQLSTVSSPSLTFLRRNSKEIGHEAFRLLMEWMEGNEEVRNVKVNVRLEVKESSI